MNLMGALRSTELHVLIALAPGALHGYALVKRIEEESDARVKILPGNLYTVLRRLVAEGLVQESETQPEPDEDQRRRYFELSDKGRRVLSREANHLERLVTKLRSLALKPSE